MLKAIETVYKGYKFRSRLEARWAVFFDALGIKWEYEPEGFELPSGERYLPDFFLPKFNNGGLYVEVKPEEGDFSKAIEFAITHKVDVMLAAGVPDTRVYTVQGPPDKYWPEHPGTWVGIPMADQASSEYRMYGEPGYENSDGTISPEYYDCLGQHYLDAVKAAKQARFEHGEKPSFR